MVKAGHTQQTLEKYTGIDQSLISRYMSGKTSPPLEAFDKIESFLKSQGV
ncbi:MAG: helix-turn-helix domain-containing protein [Candidatus Puniceispirillaceae bacterium]